MRESDRFTIRLTRDDFGQLSSNKASLEFYNVDMSNAREPNMRDVSDFQGFMNHVLKDHNLDITHYNTMAHIEQYTADIDNRTRDAFTDPSNYANFEDCYSKELILRNILDKLDWLVSEDELSKEKCISLKQMLESTDEENVILALEFMNALIKTEK